MIRDATTAICITSSFRTMAPTISPFSFCGSKASPGARAPLSFAQLQMNMLGHFQVADGYRGVRNRWSEEMLSASSSRSPARFGIFDCGPAPHENNGFFESQMVSTV
ncbi:hypothetical protein GE21DRAFT_9397 [Neurospora crassa]|uniref:Uncharacterized protein n=1 Tax=Neurospora crassa (strain ATCC 24698 / 74-OR23-1A / CBS 708.71 / DSM 1257 / FGSC 987) TaxID=367110 RepID=Q7S2C9_NEUCR|nr:hypothetical protein NCU05949 [Neurospora crassa OR74A]EAA29557.1 hypothetical protein NCU05949 [Neurospora crassa OR74A]KHE87524.1 hypothetical protein GE21DRAFT_9397 [Neurospora crassa]|eukprot:XP_958793.1 hypothetical protein NCU05949 [Neurospora crassa OR74A]